MTIRLAIGSLLGRVGAKGVDVGLSVGASSPLRTASTKCTSSTIAPVTVVEREPKPLRRLLRLGDQLRLLKLGDVDQRV